MNIVERARVALRNWINKPAHADLAAAESTQERWLSGQLNELAECFDREAQKHAARGPEAYVRWLESQRASVDRMEAEGLSDDLNVRGRALLRAKVNERLSLLALATAG